MHIECIFSDKKRERDSGKERGFAWKEVGKVRWRQEKAMKSI